MGAKATVKLSFQVTLQQPEGMTVKDTRESIVRAIRQDVMLGMPVDGELKVHLVNKETSYGKR